MFWIGFFLPFLWIMGALISPTDRAAARFAGSGVEAGLPFSRNRLENQ
jgi:hypothetical protein